MRRHFTFSKKAEAHLKRRKWKNSLFYDMQIRPEGADERIPIGKADATFTAIRFDGTTKGALIIDREHAEAVAYDDKHELWVIPRADGEKYRAWLDAEYPKPLKRDSWRKKMGAIASKLVTARRNPGTNVRKQAAIIREKEKKIRSLEDRLRKREAYDVEHSLDGFINAPFPLENGVILHWGADRYFSYWEDGRLNIEYVEANFTTSERTPDMTDNQDNHSDAIGDGNLRIRFWHYYLAGDGTYHWALKAEFSP